MITPFMLSLGFFSVINLLFIHLSIYL
jgi:hypothetical protein